MMLRVKILRTQAGAEKQWGVIKAQDFPSQQQVYEVNYTMALAMGACYLPLQGLSQYCCSCWFSTFPERSSGWRAEFRHSVLGGGRGDWQNGSSDRYFQESIL